MKKTRAARVSSKRAASTATPAIRPVELEAFGSEEEVAAAALDALVSSTPIDVLRLAEVEITAALDTLVPSTPVDALRAAEVVDDSDEAW